MTDSDIIANVQQINEDIFEKIGSEHIYLIFGTNGWCSRVMFLGTQIWSSEDDMREWVTEDSQEEIGTFLRREVLSEIGKLQHIKVRESK